MRVAVLTPLPPTRSGVAHYASLLLPALRERAEVQAFATLEGYRRVDFDHAVYQLGNNPHHELMYAEAMREPGVVVLHDLVLHHLIVETTLARGDAEGYVEALRQNHGEAGAAWARGRAHGLHSEMGNFLLPASVEIARRARAVIVHNQYARDRLLSFGVQTPIHVVPHPYEAESRQFDRLSIRGRLGIQPHQRVIGFFGFLTSAKRAEVVLDAFRSARGAHPELTLLIVGEPAPNIDVTAMAGKGVIFTGYASDEEFPSYYAAADRFVNLRYPSAGETSGTLIRALDAGKPVAVSDYAQFAEFPDDCVFRIPLGAGELEGLVEFFTADLADPSRAQRAWLQANARIELTVEGYMAALEGRDPQSSIPHPQSSLPIPLFPQLELLSASGGQEIALTIRNDGSDVIRTRTYGQPEYRLIVKQFHGDEQTDARWIGLPGDLHPAGSVRVTVPHVGNANVVRLFHALQDVPMLEPEAWAEAVLVR